MPVRLDGEMSAGDIEISALGAIGGLYERFVHHELVLVRVGQALKHGNKAIRTPHESQCRRAEADAEIAITL